MAILSPLGRLAAAQKTFADVIDDSRLFLLPLVDVENGQQIWLRGGPWSKEKENAR